MLSPFECLCGNFILPEPASYVFFYAFFNLRKLLYIIRVSGQCEKKIKYLYEQFPYDSFAKKRLEQLLNREHIYDGQGCYADCVSAGMLAYMYSIHRCAYMDYNNVEGYIAKMLRIYILCAIVAYKDAENLCKENGFRQIRIDQMENPRV